MKFEIGINLKNEWPLLLGTIIATAICSVGGILLGWYINEFLWAFWVL